MIYKLELLWVKLTRARQCLTRAISAFILGWKSEDWDYCYTLNVFSWHLKRLERQIRVNSRHVSAQRDAKNIRVCLHLIDRICNKDYTSPRLDRLLDQKWSTMQEIKLDNGGTRLDFEENESLARQIKLEFKKKAQIEAHDWELLGKIISKHMQTWWD